MTRWAMTAKWRSMIRPNAIGAVFRAMHRRLGDSHGCYFSGFGCVLAVLPLVGIYERTESGHSVDSVDPPSYSGLPESYADEVPAGTFNASAADVAGRVVNEIPA